MKYIKFNLVKFDKALAFQILEQNLRKTPRNTRIVLDVDGFMVTFRRDTRPELRVNVDEKEIIIYGRGSSSTHHKRPKLIYFEDNFDRDKIFDILVKSFELISENLK